MSIDFFVNCKSKLNSEVVYNTHAHSYFVTKSLKATILLPGS